MSRARVIQRLLLALSFAVCRATSWRRPTKWTVGPEELASMVSSLARAVGPAFSVSLRRSPYYRFRYSAQLTLPASSRWYSIVRLIVGPVLLGFFASRSAGFIYVGSAGFLFDSEDQREFEFRWLRAHGRHIVCYFTGSEIRSPRLLADFERSTGRETIGSRILLVNPESGSDQYDGERARIAEVAERYADLIYSFSVDQMGYFTRPTRVFEYFLPDERFAFLPEKFDSFERPVVVHAPSAPLLKGTELVRAAVEQLRAEGVEFEYVELTGVSNDTILESLRRAHIVLNQFYASVPGVFGIEALAHTCAVLQSADARVETDLPSGANEAWWPTVPAQLTEHLRALLGDRERARSLAIAGYVWAREWGSASRSGERLLADLAALTAARSAH